MRGHRLAFATVIAWLLGWGTVAHASWTMAPSTIATPSTNVGVASGAATGTLSTTDNGNTKIDIAVGTCSGSGAGTFTFTPATTMFMNSTVISVTYTPSALGPRSCGVNVFPMGQTSGAYTTFTVTGDGARPPTISPGSIMPFSAVRAFDGAVAARTSTRPLTITNTGDRALDISSVVTSGDFDIDPGSAYGAGATSISGGSAKTWTLRFNPSGLGTRNGSVTFNSNDPSSLAKVVSLTGDGTSGAFTIAQNANGNFGQVAAGTAATLDISVTHSGTNTKGVLTLGTATLTSASMPWFTITAQPTALDATTATGNVTISCSPPALATATATATVTIVADSDPGFPTTRTQDISCQGGASALALSLATVDFAPTLVGTMTGPLTVTITNSGTTGASVQFTPTGGNAARFAAVGPGNCGGGTPCSIPSGGGAIDVTVTFAPLAEGTVGASFTLSGGGPSVGFSVTGRGIDRHINLPDAIQVGDTFRNPGSKATRTPVPITNSGEYPLVISALDIGGNSAVWAVDDETLAMLPITVPYNTTVNIVVRFSPTTAGKADDGQLLINNDDTKVAGGTPIVLLAGNGKDRNVDINPGAVDVGDTFAGVPTRLSVSRPTDMLAVINQEISLGTDNDFVIREIKIEGDDAAMFRAQDLDGDLFKDHPFSAGESVSVDVAFNPTHVGEFEATLVLYLDEDPEYVKLIPVRGRALYVDAHGSGGFGCSTGGRSRGAMGLLIVALGLVLRRRRR